MRPLEVSQVSMRQTGRLTHPSHPNAAASRISGASANNFAPRPRPPSSSRIFFLDCLMATVALSVIGFAGTMWFQKRQLAQQVLALASSSTESCVETCKFNSEYGRWHSQSFAHACWSSERNQIVCECTGSPKTPKGCHKFEEVLGGGADASPMSSPISAATAAARLLTATAPEEEPAAASELEITNVVDEEPSAAIEVPEPLRQGRSRASLSRRGASSRVLAAVDQPDYDQMSGSPRQTVARFCDAPGMKEMRGGSAGADLEDGDPAHDLEAKILGDVARELETNNVDKMAKEIFTFYVCARWAPDKTFWQLAEQELAAQIVESTVKNDESPGQAIAELYQTYKFVPMLCSENFDVYDQTDKADKTYFTSFRKQVNDLATWLGEAVGSAVGNRLTEIDNVFCGDEPMNTCARKMDFDQMINRFTGWCPKWLCAHRPTREDLWKQMEGFFKSLEVSGRQETTDLDADIKRWKKRFPFHSFIAKPQGWTATDASPRANERFLICFGKRVASELHRRPSGQHIMTDQNNIGCHGWFAPDKAGEQVRRIVELWKPPTCQMADMTYTMKKEIMVKFQQMNERLFDSLPSMINDEMMEEDLGRPFDFDEHLPKPVKDRKSLKFGNKVFVETMKVRWIGEDRKCLVTEKCEDGFFNDCVHGERCDLRVSSDFKQPSYGIVTVIGKVLAVTWDQDKHSRPLVAAAEDLDIVPASWMARKGLRDHAADLVAGVGHIHDRAKEMFNAMFSSSYTNLAGMMSGSVSKWAVCPIRDDADLNALDGHLGVEDATFKDFQQEAYKKWTGFQAEIPGEKCLGSETVSNALGKAFPDSKICEFSELMADHVEKYTKDLITRKKEEFICPVRPPLPADEQLQVLSQKQGTCFLRMTGKQGQQYGWHYQGRFPARRQNDRKPNVPKPEYELVKLLKVPGGGPTSEVSLGRFCSYEELTTQPRFCVLPKVHNSWPTMAEFAENLAEGIKGSLGIGGSAIALALKTFQAGLKQNGTKQEKFQEAAMIVKEEAWDKLTGAGRLLRSSPAYIKQKLTGNLVGDRRLAAELQNRLFDTQESGELLHMLSFQKSLGGLGLTTNSKERFQRYALAHPCKNFDPAYEFLMRKRWNRIALQMIHELRTVRKDVDVLTKPFLRLTLRGEALQFRVNLERKQEDYAYHKPMASMQWEDPSSSHGHLEKSPNCQQSILFGCAPQEFCEKVLGVCMPKPWWTENGWWQLSPDNKLIAEVAPTLTSGKFDLNQMYGFRMKLHCAPKKNFGSTGPPSPTGMSLRKCLEDGVATNAKLKAESPWKLYFPEEVVVVASFTAIANKRCLPAKDGAHSSERARRNFCKDHGAALDRLLDQHLSFDRKSEGKEYEGMVAGAGFPKGTLEEVVLAPEDVLEALGLLPPSAHGSWM
eukprot:TRINITY_DN26017_c0_g1_i1.p1 TRINITY_DN26017_c0_g1~~TRINITY_DN26017_c0_g1_i1.p1  ORF type:complete len:1397 (+),score=342.16 TRINITY_DN26017_c0_g1_i1:148-4338(+)